MQKKALLTTILVLILSGSAFSQLGIKGGFALGESMDGNSSDLNLGFDIGIMYEVNEKIRAEILFERIAREDNISLGFLGSIAIKSSIMPITIGGDYRFLTGPFQPYAGLNVGMYRFKAEAFGQVES